jgi:hypothetical protein
VLTCKKLPAIPSPIGVNMDVANFIAGIIGGALGGSAFATILINTLKDRWMERVKANYAAELEQLKNSLASNQAALQAQLDQGTHVTTAQYDLELSAYKDLWEKLSDLRERWRGIFNQGQLLSGEQGPHVEDVLNKAFEEMCTAHDQAILVSGKFSPFYEKCIRDKARTVTLQSSEFQHRIKEWINSKSAPTDEELASRDAENSTRLVGIYNSVEDIDDLIRDRLTSLRIVKS